MEAGWSTFKTWHLDTNLTEHDGPQQSHYHQPVLLQEAIDGLNIAANGIYVDCTFGGGGHSREILKRLNSDGRLLVFDQDADAKANVPNDGRVQFIASNFRHIQRFLRMYKQYPVDGLLADLGVSSHQFDEASRGFSTRYNGELDMRMDRRQILTASSIVNTYSEQQLHKLFEEYGEVSNSKTLAKMIVTGRSSGIVKTVDQFKATVHGAVRGNPNRYFAQVFQALRIEVNDELGSLRELLVQVPDVLKPGGRAVFITFHSLEDRIVKNFFRNGRPEELPQNPFTRETPEPLLRSITKKPVVPSEKETTQNPRARSAKLRVAERI